MWLFIPRSVHHSPAFFLQVFFCFQRIARFPAAMSPPIAWGASPALTLPPCWHIYIVPFCIAEHPPQRLRCGFHLIPTLWFALSASICSWNCSLPAPVCMCSGCDLQGVASCAVLPWAQCLGDGECCRFG